MAHTPGPWKWQTESVYNGGDARDRSWLYSGSDPVLEYAGCGSHECSVSDDDARLIAAAPDLLAALYNMLEDGDKTDREQALAAIAKATQPTGRKD